MAWLIGYLLLALGVSFMCSVLEAVVLSVPRTHVEVMFKSGSRAGKVLKEMTENIDRPLAAILSLNTVAHTIGAAGVGAEALAVFGPSWVTLSSVVLTLLILFLSEIIPKTLGTVYSKQLAGPSALLLVWLVKICYPLVVASEALARLITPGRKTPQLSRAEMLVMAELGEDQGTLLSRESRVIRNLLRLETILISDAMTPESVVSMFQEDTTLRELTDTKRDLSFARAPIYSASHDHVSGQVHRYDILQALLRDELDVTLKSLAKPIHSVSAGDSIASCFESFIERQEQLFVVAGEQAETVGVVTLEDAVETLLGVEIVDETDSVEDMRELARRRAEQRHRVARKRSELGVRIPTTDR